jgi:hypothetical protein
MYVGWQNAHIFIYYVYIYIDRDIQYIFTETDMKVICLSYFSMRTQYISFRTVLQKCKICTQPSICKIFGSRNGFALQPSLCPSPSHRFFFNPAGIEVLRSSYIGTIELNRTPSIKITYLKQKYARFYLRACKSFKKAGMGLD